VPELFANKFPDDVWHKVRELSLICESGRWKTQNKGASQQFTAKGSYPFVVCQGVLILTSNKIRSSGGGAVSHIDLAHGRDVEFAGEIRFGSGQTTKGMLRYWNDKTGHYYDPIRKMDPRVVTMLPLDCFEKYEDLP